MCLSGNNDASFQEEVVFNFWGGVGLLDTLLVIFGPIIFLVCNVVIVDKLLVLFGPVLFFISSLPLQWVLFGGKSRSYNVNLDNGLWSLKWMLVN